MLVVLHVTSPNKDDVYGDKALITLYVTFSAPVVITGHNVVGELHRAGDCTGFMLRLGDGTAVLEFEYNVEYGDDLWKFGLRPTKL